MQDSELRASLQSAGQLEPALRYEGALLDGRKRQRLCSELGVHFLVHDARSLHDACSLLWSRDHRVRALELAGVRPIVELAELCGTTASAIALERQRQNPPPKPPRKQYRPRKQARKLQKLILLEPELYLAACSAARDLGHGNFCQFVRDALRSAIAAR